MGEDGGHPPDFGHLSDEDMSEIIGRLLTRWPAWEQSRPATTSIIANH